MQVDHIKGSRTFSPALSRQQYSSLFRDNFSRLARYLQENPSRISKLRHALRIGLSFATITLLVLLLRQRGDVALDLAVYLYFIPILLAGYYFGAGFAFFASLAVAFLFVPHLAYSIANEGWSIHAEQDLGVVLSFVISGILVSALVGFSRQHQKLLRTVESLGEIIDQSLDLQNLSLLMLHQSLWLGPADGGEVVLLQRDGPPLVGSAGRRLSKESGTPFGAKELSDTLLDWLMKRNELVVIPDLQSDSRFELPPELSEEELALLALPLHREGQPVGVLALWRLGNRVFSKEEEKTLHELIDKSQVALEKAWVYSQTDRELVHRTRDLSMLVDTSAAFASAQTVDELLGLLCRIMAESVESTVCRVHLRDEDQARLVLRASSAVRASGVGAREEKQRGVRSLPIQVLPWHQQTMAEGAALVLRRDDASQPVAEPEYSFTFQKTYQSALLVPLTIKGHSLGVISLCEERRWDRTPFTEEKLHVCSAIARQAALAIEGIRTLESSLNQRRQIQLVLDNVADGIFRTDLEGHLVTFNQAAERITGFSSAEVLGRECRDVLKVTIEGTGASALSSSVTEISQPHQAFQSKEWITRRDGAKILVSHSEVPILDPDGECIGAVSMIRDITREEELVRLKSDFISMVSHELRTPLATISATSELIAKKELIAPEGSEMLQVLNQECTRLRQLVDQVLEASRLEKGQISLRLEPLSLLPLTEQLVNAYRSRYPDNVFQIVGTPDLPFAFGDLVSVRVILENLIQNTINYSPAGSTVTISLEDQEDHLLITVADQGMGIPRDQLDSIFTRFHRLPDARKDKPSGFGLGLYIARMLVESQGGMIWAESEPGKGSRFCFTLGKLGGLVGTNTGH